MSCITAKVELTLREGLFGYSACSMSGPVETEVNDVSVVPIDDEEDTTRDDVEEEYHCGLAGMTSDSNEMSLSRKLESVCALAGDA